MRGLFAGRGKPSSSPVTHTWLPAELPAHGGRQRPRLHNPPLIQAATMPASLRAKQ